MNVKRYLLWFAHENITFKIPEIESICSVLNISVKWIRGKHSEPFVIVDLPSEQAVRSIASRSVLVRSAFELWGHGQSQDELYKALQQLPSDFMSPYTNSGYSFRLRIDTFCRSLTKEQKLKRIHDLNFLPFNGHINLRDPTYSFHLLEYYGIDPNNIPENPHDVFFGKWVCDGKRDAIHKLSLKQRKFIGNTSMDPQLSLIMANQAKVKKGSLVLDPFVGSGSLLVAASYFGAYVLGNDLDYLTIHGKAKPTRCNQKKREADESILTNMKQYGLHNLYLDVIIADTARPMWRHLPLFDAIITDPPYGIREATERVGSHKVHKIKPEQVQGHIPSRIQYKLEELFNDLIELASKVLKLNGRLVFWIPVYNDDYSEESIPKHPCFKLVSNSSLPLTKHSTRHLVTMEKICEPDIQEEEKNNGANSISQFRDRYFQLND